MGWVVHPADIEGMKRVLREIYEKWKQNAPFVQPDEEEIRKFSLPVQVEKLSYYKGWMRGETLKAGLYVLEALRHRACFSPWVSRMNRLQGRADD